MKIFSALMLIPLLLCSGCKVFYHCGGKWLHDHDLKGDRGCCTPGDRQYREYLAYLCEQQKEVGLACRSLGNPDVIQIGWTGSRLVWTDFSGTSGNVKFKLMKVYRGWQMTSASFVEDEKDLKKELDAIGKSPGCFLSIGACVRPRVVDYEYKAKDGRGFVAVNHKGCSLQDARRVANAYIEDLVREKGVLLTTGVRPPEAKYTSGNEYHRPGEPDVLVIEFETN